MKTDINGVSQCQKGTENYETFYTTIRRKKTKLVQYDYRNEDGELFSCVKPTLTECRKARDEHFKPVTVVYTPAEFKEKGFDGEIAKYMREHTNTAIVGDVPGLTAMLSGIGRIRIGRITKTLIQQSNNPPGVRPRHNNKYYGKVHFN